VFVSLWIRGCGVRGAYGVEWGRGLWGVVGGCGKVPEAAVHVSVGVWEAPGCGSG
jgi:hypothetical protein